MKQKEKQKRDKEAGIKPKKRPKVVEPGSDDCGEDLSGLGRDVAAYGADMFPENVSESSDEELFVAIPWSPAQQDTDVFSAVASLCDSKHNQVDLVEICGGA